MLKSVLEFSLARRAMVLAGLALFVGFGVWAFHRLNIEAYPNPAPPIIQIIAQNPGQSAEEIERYVTIPIELGVAGLPGLRYVRSTSLYGLSFVSVQFSYETEYQFSLQQVLNRLNAVSLPSGVSPTISPTSPVGEIFRYQLAGPPGMGVTELKTLQDWVLERRFRTVPGVIDVVAEGGSTKEYQAEVDLNRLIAYNLTLPQVIAAIANSNVNVGGRTLSIGQQAVNVRGIGLIGSPADIEDIVLAQSGGTPVLVKDVAQVRIGHMPRLGIVGRDNQDDVVTGIVLMRRGEKTQEVIRGVEAEVERLNRGGVLPPGVRIVPYYNLARLIGITTGTVLHNLLFGSALVFAIQWAFLGNLRSALIVAATIPFALFFSTIVLVLRGHSANLLSVGAIDFGIIVDATVILMENIIRNLREGGSPTLDGVRVDPNVGVGFNRKLRRILGGAVEVDKAIFFSAAITICAFIPLFTMQGVEGQIFGPMARTYAYALAGALLATFTVSPVLASYLLPEVVTETETWLVRHLRSAYEAMLDWVMRHRKTTLAGGAAVLLAVGLSLPFLGTEFLPKLEEGNLWIRASLPPTISLEAGAPVVAQIRAIIGGYPETETVISQQGRPDDGTDPSGFFNVEFYVPLKPQDQWRPGLTKEKLVDDLQQRLEGQFVGINFNFSQYLQDNVEEALSGVKGENSVKLFGSDLEVLEAKATEIKRQLDGVRGVRDLGIFRELGQPNLVIKIDRAAAARYSLSTGDINAVIQAAVGGQQATTVYEGEWQFPLVVRLAPEYRNSIENIRNIPVAVTAAGGGVAYIPLGDLAAIGLDSGASYIYRENNARYIPLKFSVRERDLGGTIAEAQERVESNVTLPERYRTEWSGEFGSLQEAKARLAYIVPLSFLLILMLLYGLFNSLRYSLLALAGIPFALCGGVVALFAARLNFSISAAVGFISLLGVSVMNGILMLTYYQQGRAAGLPPEEAMLRSAHHCMRPVLMTALSACIGLLPAALSTGIGSQVQRPLATVVVGGMLVEPFTNLLFGAVLRMVFVPRASGAEAAPANAEDMS